jgi:hypothetical protein
MGTPSDRGRPGAPGEDAHGDTGGAGGAGGVGGRGRATGGVGGSGGAGGDVDREHRHGPRRAWIIAALLAALVLATYYAGALEHRGNSVAFCERGNEVREQLRAHVERVEPRELEHARSGAWLIDCERYFVKPWPL